MIEKFYSNYLNIWIFSVMFRLPLFMCDLLWSAVLLRMPILFQNRRFPFSEGAKLNTHTDSKSG